MSYTYEYPRPSGTVDSALVAPGKDGPRILLIRRGHEPFTGDWALPGGFLELEEELVTGAARELAEETMVSGVPMQPLFLCGAVGRDPRGRTLTMVYGALVDAGKFQPKGSDDAAEAAWHPLDDPPKMAFDHRRVLAQIAQHLRWQASTAIIGRHLLGPETDEASLVSLHQNILGGLSPESPFDRGIRLGLLKRGAAPGRWRFIDPPEHGPDWVPLVW